jgi:DNA repair exonuclease SbcCD ATPase subunit
MSFSIELTNFKTFEKFILKVPSSGLILLDGVSGKGKTTIIQSIVFAVTGVGKKLATYGTKKVKVKMVKYTDSNEQEYSIVREKAPDSLMFIQNNKEYHDDEAQIFINNIFGKNFEMSSVIFQKGSMSFLSLSPKEKISQIENILFSDFSVEDKKTKLKKLIKSKEEDLQSLMTKIETLELVIRTKNAYTPSNKFNNLSTVEDCESYKNEHNKIYKNKKLQLSTHKEELQYIKELLLVDDNNIKERENILSCISRLDKDLQDYKLELKEYSENIDIDSKKNRLEVLTNTLKMLKLKSDLYDEEKRLDTTSEQLCNNIKEDINKVTLELNEMEDRDISTKIKKKEEEYEQYQGYLTIKNRVQSIENKIYDRKKYIEHDTLEHLEKVLLESECKLSELTTKKKETELAKLSLKCPCCSSVLRYISANHSLEKFQVSVDTNVSLSSIENDIASLLKTMQETKTKLTTFKKIADSIETLSKDKEQNLKELSTNIIDMDVDDMNKKILQMKEQVELLKEQKSKIIFNKTRLKQLEEYLKDVKNNNHPVISTHIDKIKSINIMLNNISNADDSFNLEDKENIEKEIASIKSSLVNDNLVVYKKQKVTEKISHVSQELENLKSSLSKIVVLTYNQRQENMKKLETRKDNISELEEYMASVNIISIFEEIEKQINYLKYIQETEEMKKTISDNLESKGKVSNEIEKLEKLFRGVEVSESKLIYRFVDTLNERVNYHLEAMFTEPMTVQVKCFKDTKKGEKPHIDFIIYYKGNETEISNLSGGEFDRLNLAFLLSFNELSESNVVILDEAMSSLNQELVADIIEHVQDCNKNNSKLVLMTLHQSIKGMFDQVISL